jgi:hypothetical protein
MTGEKGKERLPACSKTKQNKTKQGILTSKKSRNKVCIYFHDPLSETMQ